MSVTGGQQAHQIVIVGGGAGGLELATRLGDRLGKKKRACITLIDASPSHLWKPLLYEVAAGSLDSYAERLEYLAQGHWHGFTFRLGRMDGLDRQRQEVSVAPTLDDDGVEIIPRRSFHYDTLIIGLGCAGAKSECDDMHLLEGSQAVIQRRRDVAFGGGQVDALLFTSLHERAAKILLNVESGDFGVHEVRNCGCGLEEAGLCRHLHSIRSFDKLTGEGMTFVGTDLVRIIEQVLPARFGGSPTDYQMLETEDAASRTRVDILVSPRVGHVDADEVIRVILAELSRGSDTNRMMAEVWRQGDVLRLRREEPRLTSGGKLLSLHILKEAKR